MMLINPYSVQPSAAQNIFQILTTLGLTTNLQFCLDAGEGDSYTSGQSWLDLTANDQDFFLGADVTATATDPTFNGVADALSSAEFFSFDGGDYFIYDTTNETWMENLHKDNAAFSFAGWMWPASFSATAQLLISTVGGSALTGIQIGILGTTNLLNILVRDAAGGTVHSTSHAAPAFTEDAWNFFGGGFDEAGNAKTTNVNGEPITGTVTYSSPAATAATEAMKLGARGAAALPIQSGGRMAILCMWGGTALTSAQLMNIYAATKGRFGL